MQIDLSDFPKSFVAKLLGISKMTIINVMIIRMRFDPPQYSTDPSQYQTLGLLSES